MINKIGIIGGGKMGTDIFYFLSDFPFQLTWLFKSQMKLEKTREDWIKKQQRALKYNRLDEDTYHEKLLQIQFTSDLSTLADCDLIIESITDKRYFLIIPPDITIFLNFNISFTSIFPKSVLGFEA